ncbi:acetate--CoA ligase family protein [Albimonas sp. CAU 1670]|uniref:acetate--CoA ligase family protein n=1 Tax=Albimonas sp. CAU 1670 TaxID=3032599 RepID=UPI0023DC29F7|nr:acetate--CoA ligase family protein [Albimonas sp. CAU 1670]MDF2232249.1 acetate--CoA ligase family protein [Albimonas sp. CAU 1670]
MPADGAPRPVQPLESLAPLFAPRSVAVIGASADPSRIGGRPIAYALRAGFAGKLFPVNPNREEIQGVKAWPSVAAIPEPIDFALLAIPAAGVPQALRDCAAKGAKAAVIFTAGFAEIGGEGPALQAEILDIARTHGLRLLGPNCLGLFNAATGHCPTFTSGIEAAMPVPGRVGLVTQSGAYGTHLLNMARDRRIGVRLWVSTGNEADVTAPECIGWMAASDEIDLIGVYMEGVNDRPAFFRALAAARAAKKPVVVMKVGSSTVGAEAAASHTASLAGSDASFDAVLRRHGALRAKTTEEMLDILYAASLSPLPKGRRLGVLTASGGAGVLIADAAEEAGLTLPPLPQVAQDAILSANPLASARNPVDVTAGVLNDFSKVTNATQNLRKAGGYDMTAAFFTSWTASPVVGPKLRAALLEGLEGGVDHPFAMICQGDSEVMASWESQGMMTFEDPSRAIHAMGALARLAEAFDAPEEEPLPPLAEGVTLPTEPLSEFAAKQLLAKAGVPIPDETLATTPQEAADAAARLGAPCVLKIVSPDLAHKTEVGGVRLNVPPMEMETAAREMLATVAAKAPHARIEGLLVGPMAGEGVELIVGARRDPVMGPVMLIGLGGVFTEILKDVAVELAPLSPAQARKALEGLRGAALLQGARGKPPVAIDEAALAISRLSVLAASDPDGFESLEINPLLATPTGVLALDALIEPRAATPETQR